VESLLEIAIVAAHNVDTVDTSSQGLDVIAAITSLKGRSANLKVFEIK